MPSVHTAPPTEPGPTNPVTVMRRAVAVVAVLLLLAACNTGNARDARRGQSRDLQTPVVMPLEQATQLAKVYFPPTPSPKPTEPLPAYASAVAITMAINGDASPQGAFASVPTNAAALYVATKIHGATPGQPVSAVWINANGNQIAETSATIPGRSDPEWVALPLGLDPTMNPGPYGVWVFVGARRVASVSFELTAPGNAPQIFSDLPENPEIAPPTNTPEPKKEKKKDENSDSGEGGDQATEGDGQAPAEGEVSLEEGVLPEEPAP